MFSSVTLKEILALNKNREAAQPATGVYSVCSAHKTVLEASILKAQKDNSLLIVEATSNQVNQEGGYTGMKAPDFTAYIKKIADSLGYPFEKIILGGDHLGPNVWQGDAAENAMQNAGALVRSYVKAGFKKIHLDTSMFCRDDGGDRAKPLADKITAERTARLCAACEAASSEAASMAAVGDNWEKPFYIIGTEVPVPGGSKEKETNIKPTEPESIKNTIAAMESSFKKAGLEDAWGRVIAVVAQPGVEFGDDHVFYYDREKAKTLSHALDNTPLVYEAHSTDYQTRTTMKYLVEDHFCILKVGPALTYAYREAVFALASIEKELGGKIAVPSKLMETAEKVMLGSQPNYWEKYYHGTDGEKAFARKFSLSDRIRYYWPNRDLAGAVEKLFGNLSAAGIPRTLLSQYMPSLFMPVCEGLVKNSPKDLAIAHIQGILDVYAHACGFTGN
jgi:D-tagatose-1,6-bisphosphate aldolase subunit GatZ/KbaZ